MFKNSGLPKIPNDICRIDTYEWYSENWVGQNHSFDALRKKFRLTYEQKRHKMPKLVCEYYLYLEIFKLCAGVKTLELLMQESLEKDSAPGPGPGPGESSTAPKVQVQVRVPNRLGLRSSSKQQAIMREREEK